MGEEAKGNQKEAGRTIIRPLLSSRTHLAQFLQTSTTTFIRKWVQQSNTREKYWPSKAIRLLLIISSPTSMMVTVHSGEMRFYLFLIQPSHVGIVTWFWQ